VADDFARLVGSWIFVRVQVGIMVVWLGLNALNLIHPWDKYPFMFLNFILSLEAALWVSVVLMALNRFADRDRLRAQHDYELDVKAEEETKALMNHLMHQDEILLQIVNRLDRSDREMKRLTRRLEQATEPGPETPRPPPTPVAPPAPQSPPPTSSAPPEPERPLEIRRAIDLGGNALGKSEVALDHRSIAVAAVRSKGRPHGQRSGAAGHLRTEIHELRLRCGFCREVSGTRRESASVHDGIADKCETQVVGNVEPLVAVGDNRVGQLKPVDQSARLG